MPRFSIIMPCYNAQVTIDSTIASIQAQTECDWELICVDDGSTDLTRDVIAAAATQDARIGLILNKAKGPSAARNFGALTLARGDLVAFCDADDLWTPQKLAELATIFADQQVDGAFGQIGFFDKCPSDCTVYSTVPAGDLTIDRLLGENPVCTMSNITLRRDAFVGSGGFDVTMVHNEDLELLIRLIGRGARIIGVPSLQTWYRTSVSGLSANLAAMLSGRERALETAARFGVTPSRSSHAVHHRYLARRALRTGAPRIQALRHAVYGVAYSPRGFFAPFNRGALTLAGAVSATLLPRRLNRILFS
ncbi:glycosyltransferase family 2 protein [Paracoccus tegillarcae]|uniref:Glycosyltransferase family 2 protein n=1 Tax=Paracoccus tegillarcae TaxID=1529068 RepID=A0A2K9EFD6_9RHOB|nr:glycosyltransferase family 2 protein [Paracoccus tegillarcae]AUH33059.1 glycosyltransferase family 2 protein [Paracoccus tegillarcae]